jgi:hypothetical protein
MTNTLRLPLLSDDAAHRRPVWRLALLMLISLIALVQSGCSTVILLGYLIGGPPSKEPDFNIRTKQSLSDKGKKVLVMAYAPTEIKWDNAAVDLELAKFVAMQLVRKNIQVIDPDRVYEWLDKNNDWDKASEVGAHFEVDYVVKIDIRNYSLYEENSSDLYRGRAEVLVTVIQMDEDKKDGKPIYNREIVSKFPTQAQVSVGDKTFAEFKKLYLSVLSNEIGVLFYPSYAGDEFPNTALPH